MLKPAPGQCSCRHRSAGLGLSHATYGPFLGDQRAEQKAAAKFVKELQAASKAAIKALQDAKKPDCARLFGLTPGSPAPAPLLNSLLSSDPAVGILIVDDIASPPGQVTSATTSAFDPINVPIGNGATQRRYRFVEVTLNDLAGTFVSGSTQDQAITLLHELGHVYSYLFGPESTKITDDYGKLTASQNNTALVKSDCFK